MEDVDVDRYRSHMRRLTPAERGRLTELIVEDGCRDALVVGVIDGEKFLVDGFNRLEICNAHQIKYKTVQRVFEGEDELLSWIEANARGRRSQTNTERKFFLGKRYLREKKAHGGDRGNQHTGGKGKSVALDRTAIAIATEEGCSHQHVKNCANLAKHIAEAEAGGLGWIRDHILSERIKYTKALLDELIFLGSGGCREEIERMLAESPEKALSATKILEALGRRVPSEKICFRDRAQDVQLTFESLIDEASNPGEQSLLLLILKESIGRVEKKLQEAKS